MNTRIFSLLLAALLTPNVLAWIHFLDGSTLPEHPWLEFTQTTDGEEPGQTIVVDFTENGQPNQALRVNSGTGAHEWYLELFPEEEIAVGARFRLVEFSPTGMENLISITTRSKHLSPAPSITLVDGRLKLWTYVTGVVEEQEILDLGPAEAGVFHTVYFSARSDGWVKLWWDGDLVYDNYAPLASTADGWVEWGSGSWQFDAIDVVEFDWFGYGTQADLPAAFTSTPAHGAVMQKPAEGFSFNMITQTNLGDDLEIAQVSLILNGIDRSGDLQVSGNSTNQVAVLSSLSSNTAYKGVISFKTEGGVTHSLPVEFDTFSTNNFTFEAEDFNFDGGQFLDQITPSSFLSETSYNDRLGIEGIDHLENTTEPGGNPYRIDSTVGTQENRDTLRTQYVAAMETDPDVTDFNLSGVEAGEWLNYTRTFPAGNYHVYARMASDVGAPFQAELSKVTGATTSEQTTTSLGFFHGGPGRGFQTYDYVTLTDALTNAVVVSLSGQETLRITAVEGIFNANYYMLVPAADAAAKLTIGRSGNALSLSWDSAPGYILETSTTLLPGSWSPVQNATNPMNITPSAPFAFYRLRK